MPASTAPHARPTASTSPPAKPSSPSTAGTSTSAPTATPESRAEYDRLIADGSPTADACRAPRGRVDLTVNELILAYLGHADGYYRKDGKPTIGAGQHPAGLPARSAGSTATPPAREFGPLALKAVRQAMIDAGLCRNEVNKRVRRIVRAFKWAVAEEMVPPSVHHGLKAVAGLRRGRTEARESEPVKPVPDAHVDAVRPHVARQVWAMIELQRLTGMRPGEVVHHADVRPRHVGPGLGLHAARATRPSTTARIDGSSSAPRVQSDLGFTVAGSDPFPLSYGNSLQRPRREGRVV